MIKASPSSTTRFRSSVPWAIVIVLVLIAVVVSETVLGLNLLFGTSYNPGWDFAFPVLPVADGAVAGSWHAQRRRWVTVSAAGIELAQHGVPILVEWSNVASAQVRRWGLFAVLEVVPVDLHLVRSLAPGSRVPAVQHLTGGPGFRFEVGNLWPTPRTLRAALTRHPNPHSGPDH